MKLAILLALLAVSAVTFIMCTGAEWCIDGRGEFTGRECR